MGGYRLQTFAIHIIILPTIQMYRMNMKKDPSKVNIIHTDLISILSSRWSYLWSLRDRRVDSWPLLHSPWPTVCLCATYVVCAKWIGPALLKRSSGPLLPPELLRPVIRAYNGVQVALSAYLVYGALDAGWAKHYNWGDKQEFCASFQVKPTCNP